MPPLLQAAQGDITVGRVDAVVDAVVDAANRGLRGGGGVDGAIHRAVGGERPQAACRAIGECASGHAVVTDGFDLPARFVIHTVGPVWHGGTAGEPETLAACYRNALRVADEVGGSLGRLPRHLHRCLRLSVGTGRRGGRGHGLRGGHRRDPRPIHRLRRGDPSALRRVLV